LGAIIRGDTPHFDYIAQAAASGIVDVGLQMERPVIFGVLTTDTVEQAEARAEARGLNRGAEAAETAIEMATLIRRLRADGE
jgi:6,7-dimethyl-8-ribityllumazine synthase